MYHKDAKDIMKRNIDFLTVDSTNIELFNLIRSLDQINKAEVIPIVNNTLDRYILLNYIPEISCL